MIGRIDAIKMVVFPRLLYLFKSIPMFIPQKYFKMLHSIIIPFIWQNKTARRSKKHLCKSKTKGDFGLPDFKCFYWAVNLNNLMYWRNLHTEEDVSSDKTQSWLPIELSFCKGTCLSALLNSNIS